MRQEGLESKANLGYIEDPAPIKEGPRIQLAVVYKALGSFAAQEQQNQRETHRIGEDICKYMTKVLYTESIS